MNYTHLLDAATLQNFVKQHTLYKVTNLALFESTINHFINVLLVSDRILPIKAYLDIVREAQAQKQEEVSNDNDFLAACVYLNVEISIFSAVYCAKGWSIDFKETKSNREIVDITQKQTAADINHKLSKPNEIRGAVESNTIQTSYNRLKRRMYLQVKAPEIAKCLQMGVAKQEIMRDFTLTLTDFELVVQFAHRQNLVADLPRKRDQDIKIKLLGSNHQYLTEYAQNNDMNLQDAVNNLIQLFFVQKKASEQTNKQLEKAS